MYYFLTIRRLCEERSGLRGVFAQIDMASFTMQDHTVGVVQHSLTRVCESPHRAPSYYSTDTTVQYWRVAVSRDEVAIPGLDDVPEPYASVGMSLVTSHDRSH